MLIYALIIIFQNKKIKKVSNILLSIFLVVQILSLTNIIFSNEKTIRWSNQEKTFLEKIVLGYQFQNLNSGNYRYDKLVDFIEKEKIKAILIKLH